MTQVAVAVQIVSPKAEPLKSLRIVITWRDEPIHVFAPSEDALAELQSAEDPDPSVSRRALSVDLKIPNLRIDESGKLRALVVVDGDVLNHTALTFRFKGEAVPAV